LEEEIGPEPKIAKLKRGRAIQIKENVGEKDDKKLEEAAPTKLAPALQSPLRVDEPVVTLQLRILPIK